MRLASTPESLRLADQDCWGICTADDIIEEVGRQKVIDVVNVVKEEVENLFSLVHSDEPLTFDSSLGRYVGVYNSKGYPSEEACARDCTLLNGAAVKPYYCVTGVPADVVLSITKPPVIPGVAGTGGGCASEEAGRPTWIVFAWQVQCLPSEMCSEDTDPTVPDVKDAIISIAIIVDGHLPTWTIVIGMILIMINKQVIFKRVIK